MIDNDCLLGDAEQPKPLIVPQSLYLDSGRNQTFDELDQESPDGKGPTPTNGELEYRPTVRAGWVPVQLPACKLERNDCM